MTTLTRRKGAPFGHLSVQFNQTFAVSLGPILSFSCFWERRHAGHRLDKPAVRVVFQLPKWTDRCSHVSFRSVGSWPATAGAFRVARLWAQSVCASGHHFLRCPFGIELWLVCALHMSESSENAASQCAHREHAPNDVEGTVPVRRGRVSSEDRRTPVRGQAVKQSAEMRRDKPLCFGWHPLRNFWRDLLCSDKTGTLTQNISRSFRGVRLQRKGCCRLHCWLRSGPRTQRMSLTPCCSCPSRKCK